MKALEELRVNGEVSEETTDSYREIYKVSSDALVIKEGGLFLSFFFFFYLLSSMLRDSTPRYVHPSVCLLVKTQCTGRRNFMRHYNV